MTAGLSTLLTAPIRIARGCTSIAHSNTNDCSHQDQNVFNQTSGRYLFNKKGRLEERWVSFNLRVLQDVAAKSVQRDPSKVVSLRKHAEEGFDRVLVVAFDDGFEVIVKVS